MSREDAEPGGRALHGRNVDVLRAFFAELNAALAGEADLAEVARRYIDPECVSELGVVEGTVSGIAGFVGYLRGQLAIVDGMRIDPEEFVEAGERVVMPFRLHGRAKETSLPLSFSYAQLFTMRGSKIVHSRMYASRDRALLALGAAGKPATEGY